MVWYFSKEPCHDGVLISEENYRALQPFVATCRLFCLCPIKFQKVGNLYRPKWAACYLLYSYFIVTTLSVFTSVGLAQDIRAGSSAIRMKDAKAIYITVCDFSTVIIIDVLGIISIPYKMKHFCQLLQLWNNIDAAVPINNYKKHRKRSVIFLAAVLIGTTALFSYDVFVYAVVATCTKCLFENFGAYYFLYFIIFFQEVFIAHLLYFIYIRIEDLNGCILAEKKKIGGATRNVFFLPHCDPDGAVRVDANRAARIMELVKVYQNIRKSVYIVNNSSSFGVVLLLLSCLIHLVVTPYFLVLEIIQRGNGLFVVLYVVWILAHISRLLMIVEPCHKCLKAISITKDLICDLMMNEAGKDVTKAVKIFMQHLSVCDINFEACSFFCISRNLLTTIAGAVATYLVILFQFNGTY